MLLTSSGIKIVDTCIAECRGHTKLSSESQHGAFHTHARLNL